MDVSIIIVSYNTKDILYNCLSSIYNHTKEVVFEVIISDNGSTDGSLSMIKQNFPQAILIENNANLGFGAANNKGLEIASGKYIFYLNSDTVLLNNAVKLFYDYWENTPENETLGALGCNLLDENLNVIHSYGTFAGYKLSFRQLINMFVSNILLSFAWIFQIKPQKKQKSNPFYIGPVDFITGADLFLKNNNLAKYDEQFFLYFEEADLQQRLAQQKKQRFIIDGPRIQHLCGGSVGSDFTIKRKASISRLEFELSRVRFLKKYNNKVLPLFGIKLTITIIWLNPLLFNSTKTYIPRLWKI